MGAGETGIDAVLLRIIACPACHGELEQTEVAGGAASPDVTAASELRCTSCGLIYPVRDGIPVLLVDEARSA